MIVRLAPQIVFAIGWTMGYVIWSRAYYRILDPYLRRRASELLGVPIVWALRQGTHNRPLGFGPLYDTWAWYIPDEHARTVAKDTMVYVLWLVAVPVLGGLWPVAVLLLVFLGTSFLSPLVALPLLFAIIPIYSIYWSGRYELAGMERGDITETV